ncbi:MAG TPA: response regulator [Anaeromyxobacteraceae bacterium]|nr:response regulator [Anaeromyxobacteraceae bacterium]
MASILLVDDDAVARLTAAKFVESMGHQTAQASNGAEGLEILTECTFDLVVLDMQMPVLDGPSMLARMREGGDGTPVIMLTAESSWPRIAEVMKSGIVDYITKPFGFEELRRKVKLAIECGGHAHSMADAVTTSAGERPPLPQPKKLVDLMVVDRTKRVHARLRAMFPSRVTMDAFTGAHEALASANERMYRALLLDADLPDFDSVALAQRLRELQPNAVLAALAIRGSTADLQSKQRGFDSVLYKPFRQDDTDAFVTHHLEHQEYLLRDRYVLELAPFAGRPEQRETYFDRLSVDLPEALKAVACASFSEAIVDVGRSVSPDCLLLKLLAAATVQARELGVGLLFVGTKEAQTALASHELIRDIPWFGTVDEARASRKMDATPARPHA